MALPIRPLTALTWTPDLARTLAETVSAIARLDARICVSPVASAWRLRASWQGYAAALRLQGIAFEEIDIIADRCGLRLPGRPLLATTEQPLADYPWWFARLAEPGGRHWREDLPFSFDPPEGWAEAPALVRSLALLGAWARADGSVAPWLAGPLILHRMGLTTTPLPCLVTGEPGERFGRNADAALLKRLLKQVRRAAGTGLERLGHLEVFAQRSAATIAAQHRPGKLAELGRLALDYPCLAARNIAPSLTLTLSGAGKLLERAARLGMLVEISGRETWRSYVTPDVAVSLDLIAPV